MNIIEAVILGLVQGLTEFLPVSSSAHLTVLPQMVGWTSPILNSLAFDVALHLGTLAAVVMFFWKDLLGIAGAMLAGLGRGKPLAAAEARLGWLLILGTIPAVVAALAFGDQVETIFRSPVWVAVWLVVFALVMVWAERAGSQRRRMDSIGVADVLVIGAAQALALMPGVSRSGSTISAGLFLGFTREQAARFTFLLSLPAILGAVVHEGRNLHSLSNGNGVLFLAGVAASAAAGLAAIKFLLAFLQRQPLYVFVGYRLLLGAAILGWVFFRG